MIPDILNLIIWLIAGVAGGNAAGDLLNADYDRGPGNTIAGAIGGVIRGAISRPRSQRSEVSKVATWLLR
jgi:uncharacterized membrane protein YeaQ/YmgE (transglycosylase-associated protein family)